MKEGHAFGDYRINQFNGGLFTTDDEIDGVHIPNKIFCERGQGQNEATLLSNRLTLLYLSASYNYASGWSGGLTSVQPGLSAQRDPERSISLYTLGRIFEQSITELEILEAEEEGRTSLNKISKRKRDGVYYTPEWVVERIVHETVGRRLADLKLESGWPPESADKLPSLQIIEAYGRKLCAIRVVDPACGSGAFLITALSYLLGEWRMLRDIRRQHGQTLTEEGSADDTVRDILHRNLYGVDINPASVEITRLALWLHTARADKPLSALDSHIREGNSLIGPDFYTNSLAPYSTEEQERINAFDWQSAFSEVFEGGGFDCVVGNPPYVKLQNYRKVHADMAQYLSQPLPKGGLYRSTQTGNFDLYLPFFEKSIQLLNKDGRLGFIAPSSWTANQYGEGLRNFIQQGRHLWGWVEFGSYQVFDEATTYTALQFFSSRPNAEVSVVQSHNGVIAEDPWNAQTNKLRYENLRLGDRWLLVVGPERKLIDKLMQDSQRLDNPKVTKAIFQGLVTSADKVYHLRRLGEGKYEERPPKGKRNGAVVDIEDNIMRPLVSGAGAKRYVLPVPIRLSHTPTRDGCGAAWT